MAYTRQQLAIELKEKIRKKETIEAISTWAGTLYDKHKREIDEDFRHLLIDLEEMKNGPEYEFTYQQLGQFADRLIAREWDLDIYGKKASAITRKQFGMQLKEKVRHKEAVHLIGRWAWEVYYEYIGYLDSDFSAILNSLNALEDGPEFELSYEELDEIADKLIAGQRVIKIYGVVENPTYEKRS